MKIDAKIDESTSRYLTPQAKEAFHESVQTYSEKLVSEASRLEAVSHSHSGDPEITAKNVADATTYLRGYPRSEPRSKWFIALQLASAVTALLVGVLFDLETIQGDTGAFYIFILVFSLALILNSAQILIGRTQ